MNLKELIKEVEWCIKEGDETALMWMRKLVDYCKDNQQELSNELGGVDRVHKENEQFT